MPEPAPPMPPMQSSAKPARQPFTPGGVARFARCPIGRVLWVAALFAGLAGVAAGGVMIRCWAPVIETAIAALPATGRIEHGALVWPDAKGRLLAANSFLSLSVAQGTDDPLASPVDLSVQFRPREIQCRSLLGEIALPYPARTVLPLNHTVLAPVWGAWRNPVTVAFGVSAALAIFFAWAALALPYSVLTHGLAAASGRRVSRLEAWKLAVAAQWPASLLLTFVLALYAAGEVNLVFLLAAWPSHFVPTVLYLFLSPFFLERTVKTAKSNPFQEHPQSRRREAANPFRPGGTDS